jgi:YbbR domain-containing protein
MRGVSIFRWFRENIGTLLFAFILALAVWAAAVNQDDPTVEDPFPEPIPIEFLGLPDDFLILGQPPGEGSVILRAPSSVWEEISAQDIHLKADLSGLREGTYRVPIRASIDLRPAQIVVIEPASIILTLEPLSTQDIDVQVATVGQPALGYLAEDPIANPDQVTIVGPANAISRVEAVRAQIHLTNSQEDLDQVVSLEPIDLEGKLVEEVQVIPETTRVTAVIKLQLNYRLVSVIPKIQGQEELEASGYRVTNVSVTPALVTIYSSDPQAFAELPGFVETVALNLGDLVETIERRLPLDLPPGFSPVGESTVAVKVGIEPMMNSITIAREIEIQGLGLGLYALPSPNNVSLILTGPAAILDSIQPEDILVVLDLLDRDVGTYQLTPQVIGVPPEVVAGEPIPATIQVIVTTTPPLTPTPTP